MSALTTPSLARASIWELVSSSNHKRVGLATMLTAVGYFFGGGLMALIMRGELARPGMQFLDYDTYNQLFTIHGSTMILIFAPPAVMGLALYMVPLQIGASELVWPRLAQLGYWLYAPSGLMLWGGLRPNTAPAKTGWNVFSPRRASNQRPGQGRDVW